MSELVPALLVLTAVCTGGVVIARRLDPGYFDLLTPICALYVLHTVTRTIVIAAAPSWAELHPIVAATDFGELATAGWIFAGSVAALVAGYVAGFRWKSKGVRNAGVPAGDARIARRLLAIGLTARLILTLAGRLNVGLPDWSLTPLETVGWAALGGLFVLSHRAAAAADGGRPGRAAEVVGAMLLTIGLAPNVGWSREAFLQPIVVAGIGWLVGKRASLARISLTLAVAVLPILVLGFGIKKAMPTGSDMGGADRLEMIRETRERYETATEFSLSAVQGRFHAMDSLLVCRYFVPAMRPYEEGNAWGRILVSAFVPRERYAQQDGRVR